MNFGFALRHQFSASCESLLGSVVMDQTYGFRVALPPLGRAGPAWYTGLLFIMKVQLLLILHCLLPNGHQVIVQLTWEAK